MTFDVSLIIGTFLGLALYYSAKGERHEKKQKSDKLDLLTELPYTIKYRKKKKDYSTDCTATAHSNGPDSLYGDKWTIYANGIFTPQELHDIASGRDFEDRGYRFVHQMEHRVDDDNDGEWG